MDIETINKISKALAQFMVILCGVGVAVAGIALIMVMIRMIIL